MFFSLMDFLFCSNQKIGMAYINHLVEKGDYDTAARYYQPFSSFSCVSSAKYQYKE